MMILRLAVVIFIISFIVSITDGLRLHQQSQVRTCRNCRSFPNTILYAYKPLKDTSEKKSAKSPYKKFIEKFLPDEGSQQVKPAAKVRQKERVVNTEVEAPKPELKALAEIPLGNKYRGEIVNIRR